MHNPAAEIKTFNSQRSDIDVFSKLEVGFLQKFFKYNLCDYFSDIIVNVYQDVLLRKVSSKTEKSMASSLFLPVRNFFVEELEQKGEKFYRSRSKSVQEGDLPFCFKLKYCNCQPVPNLIKGGQLIFVDVKLKAEVQKIEQFPDKIISSLQDLKPAKKGKPTQFERILANYDQQYFTIFIAYFGDANFNIMRKNRYQVEKIKIFEKVYKLRIFVFFISKQSLLETFRTVNKITNLEYINDLVIQFYQLKREKQKAKKRKNQVQKQQKIEKDYKEIAYKFAGIFGLVTVGFVIKKIFV